MGREQGFALIEVLIGSAIGLAAIVATCQLAADAQVAWRAAAARADLQQRVRVAQDHLTRTLRDAGAGPLSGPARTSLVRGVPAVVPRRVGARGADSPDDFRTDAFTVVRAIAESEHGVLFTPAPAGAGVIELAPMAGCSLPSCGFEAGTSLMLLERGGNHDLFTVTSAEGPVLTVRHQGSGSTAAYPAGTPAIAVESTTYALDAPSRVLRRYDGDTSDLPLLDDVVGMRVRYFGETEPPVWPRPAGGESNCLYASDGSFLSALMPVIGIPGRLVELSPAMLTDGPWCGAGGTRFDADLLRVRRVRVSVRLQAGDAGVRGTDPAHFANPGRAPHAPLLVRDAIVEIEVAPRNLGFE
jgi:hypothetical protein